MRRKKQKLKKREINYQQKLLDLFKKKSSYFVIGVSVLVFAFYFIFKIKIPPLRNIAKRKSSQKIEKPTPPKKEKFYQVKEGDTLWLIAEKFYGSGFNMEDIMKANNLTNPDIIEKGQILIIPSVPPKSPTQGEIDNHQTKKVEDTKNYYIVQPGDNLWQIALKNYGDGYAWPRIAQANKLSNPDIIKPGTKLIIPQ